MPNHEILKGVKPGDVITSAWLSSVATAINANAQAIRSPREVLQPAEDTNESTSSGSGSSVGNEVFNSTSGTETTVTVTDSNGDTSDIERVDTVVFTESTSGRTMTLNLTYPL